MARLKEGAPTRSATDVGKGDWVKVGQAWHRVSSNSAAGEASPPRSWTVRTEDGLDLSMWQIGRYAKDGDLEK